MFCIHCGQELPDNAKFCPHCGCLLEDETVTQEQVPAEEPPKEEETEETGSAEERVDTASLDEIIGKNQVYYLAEFEKIDRGEKTKFNWASFFLTIYHAAYRGVWKRWMSFMAVPIILYVACAAVSVLSIFGVFGSGTLPVILTGSVASLVCAVLLLIWDVRFAKRFNQVYYDEVKEQRTEPTPKKGPSWKRVVVTFVVVAAIVVVYSMASSVGTISMFRSMASDHYDTDDSEYGVSYDDPTNSMNTYDDFDDSDYDDYSGTNYNEDSSIYDDEDGDYDSSEYEYDDSDFIKRDGCAFGKNYYSELYDDVVPYVEGEDGPRYEMIAQAVRDYYGSGNYLIEINSIHNGGGGQQTYAVTLSTDIFDYNDGGDIYENWLGSANISFVMSYADGQWGFMDLEPLDVGW